MTNGATTTKQPNLYELSGDGIQISYSTTSIAGQPMFSYHDATLSKTFVGNQIQTVNTAAGTLVSVVILPTVDAGSTTFSVIIPGVNLRFSDTASISTYGLTTIHKFSIVMPPNGQTEFNTTHELKGTASFVVF